jgi:tungstate transport system permease protein
MWQALSDAVRLLGSLDREVVTIAALSLRVSLVAVAAGCIIGMPVGALVAIARFPGREALVVALNALMGLPAVVVGLLAYLLLSRSGPLGGFGLAFTPGGMMVAQAALVTPLIAALTRQIVQDAEAGLGEQLRSLRLCPLRRAALLVFDARFTLGVAVLAAFGRAISEVGAVLVVGGNIAGSTRTLTTAISLETQKGDLPLALALGIVLIGIVLLVNALASGLQALVVRTYG